MTVAALRARSGAIVSTLCLLAGLVAVPTPLTAAAPTAESVVAKAREHLGGDAALEAVRSIRYIGTILMQDGTNGDIEILVRKPMQQRVTITIGSVREISVLDGYDGWRRLENILDRADWQVTLMDAPQIQRLRANTAENIGFFAGLGDMRPALSLVGTETRDGVEVADVSFRYGRRVQFVRTFDLATGRLLETKTDDGTRLTEKGEIFVQGVRFPRELVTESPAGKSTVLFTRILINEPLADSLFALPDLTPSGPR
jgi:hypothetical protein